ncbi:G-type lectin S-receptor-like serine/threonine-protein kinase [Pyrus ussuriensis x Pyrus communis]|uniref:G-type lectin S-receptor-like serine/threonine-protein kinase n=1 Tax=Pyrus ussuriensis x Pyrus communis TaxID=2448454 RepID=A0A5N5IGX3_9ROSA|nr:G-type lectin S-receptor-like serine/threonine-protein kinase [Pyrus ussuriensis x Pyrus communis]
MFQPLSSSLLSFHFLQISYINQIAVPQQAPSSSIPDIQICISRAGAFLHAHHPTFLEVHSSVKPGLFCARPYVYIGFGFD